LTISSEAEFEKLLAKALEHERQKAREHAAARDTQKHTSFEVPENEIANESNREFGNRTTASTALAAVGATVGTQ
jgi:hypothetical protein